MLQKKKKGNPEGRGSTPLSHAISCTFFPQYGKSLSLRRLKYTARSSGGSPPSGFLLLRTLSGSFLGGDFYVSPGSNRLQHYFRGKHFDSVLVFPPSFIFRAASQGLRRGTLKAYGRDSPKKLPSPPCISRKKVSLIPTQEKKVNSAFLFLKWRPPKVVRRGSVGMSKGHLGG